MTKMTAERVTWVAVLDGAKALVFQDDGFSDAPDLKLVDKDQFADPPDRDIKTDAPGRRQDTGAGQMSAMEETDFHQQAEERFVHDVAGRLNEAARTKAFDRLVLMAPPRAMGWLRDDLNDETRQRIVKEMTGDYVNHPTDKLEALLKKEMAPPPETYSIN